MVARAFAVVGDLPFVDGVGEEDLLGPLHRGYQGPDVVERSVHRGTEKGRPDDEVDHRPMITVGDTRNQAEQQDFAAK